MAELLSIKVGLVRQVGHFGFFEAPYLGNLKRYDFATNYRFFRRIDIYNVSKAQLRSFHRNGVTSEKVFKNRYFLISPDLFDLRYRDKY